MKIKWIMICIALTALAGRPPKTGTEVAKDKDGNKMIVGICSPDSLMRDPDFAWFKTGYDKYKPDPKMISKIARQAASIKVVVFGGTWCSDTHDLLPKFYKVMNAAHVPAANITLHLVDMKKNSKDGSSHRFHISKVPTFIIFNGEKEAGTIEEAVQVNIETDMVSMLYQ